MKGNESIDPTQKYLSVRLRQCERNLVADDPKIPGTIATFLNKVSLNTTGSGAKKSSAFSKHLERLKDLPVLNDRKGLVLSYVVLSDHKPSLKNLLAQDSKPSLWQDYMNIVKASRLSGNTSLAEICLEKMDDIASSSQKVLLKLHRSAIYRVQGEFEKAAAELQKASPDAGLSTNTKNYLTMWESLAFINLLVDQKKFDEALKELAKINKKLINNDPLASYESGVLRFYIEAEETSKLNGGIEARIRSLFTSLSNLKDEDLMFGILQKIELAFIAQKYAPKSSGYIFKDLRRDIMNYPLFVRYPFLADEDYSELFKKMNKKSFKNDFAYHLLKSRIL